uniref:Uncharacterized protein n=1 Tax=Tolypocladium ophioglossoides (strain CBS 100239) TaxID=1163406 RepID=A0A0L0N2E8_TOLOC
MSNLVESPKAMSPEEMQNQPQNLRRKDVGNPYSSATDSRLLQPIAEHSSTAATSSAQLSPGQDDVRRRSPRQVSQAARSDFPPAVLSKDVKVTATVPLVPPPKSPLRPTPKAQTPEGPRRQAGSPTTSPHRSQPSTMIFANPNPPPQMTAQSEPSKPPKPASPRQLVELLVPPIPPLSPRKTLPPLYGGQRQTRQPLAGLARNGSIRVDIRPSRQKPASPLPEDQNKAAKAPVQLRQNNGIPSNPRARITRVTPKARGGPEEQTVMFLNGIEYDDPSAIKSIMEMAERITAKGSPDFDQSSRDSIVHRPRPIPRNSVGYSPLSKDSSKMHQDSRNRLLESIEAKPLIVPQSAGILKPATYLEHGAESTQMPSPAADATRNLRRRSSLPDISDLSQSLPTLQAVPAKSTREVTAGASTAETPGLGAGSLLYTPLSRSRQSKFVSKFSVDTAMSPLEPQSGLYESPIDNRSSNEGVRRRSSPVFPAEDQQDSPVPEDTEVQNDEFINDAGLNNATVIQPPAPASNAQDSKEAGASAVAFKSPMWPNKSTYRFVDSALLTDEDEGKETVLVMLDQSAEHRRKPQASARGPNRVSWHHRVGEDCPSFSDRKSTVMVRNMPRPPPLQLNEPTSVRKVVAAEPLRLESPQHALNMIQEQLKKFDEPREEAPANEQQRMTLLADLEMEMGMQETRWQQMRQDYSQASISTPVSSPNATAANGSLEHSPMEALADRTSRHGPSDERDARESGFYSPYSEVIATANRVQISRLNVAEGPLANGADDRFDESASSASGPGLSVDRTMPRPGNPDSIGSGNRGENREQSNSGKDLNVETGSELWRPASSPNLPRPLWKPAIGAADQSPEFAEPPAASEPVTRNSLEPLDIESSRTSTDAGAKSTGWKTPRTPSTPQEQQQQQPVTRPRTMRPPRRSKRISTLPDILEDPVPLLNKRGTLGIFQFPWGEKSDTATVPLQSRILMGMGTMGMPGNMMPGPPMYPSLEAQVRTLPSEDYPSSFFDDYDDDGGDKYADSSDDDDSFDEDTLWEIASLLRSDNVPSRESLLPGQAGRVAYSWMVEDYRADSPLPEDEGKPIFEASPVALDHEPSSPTLPAPAMLWVDQNRYASVTRTNWLPQPYEWAWKAYVASASETARAPLRSAEPATVTSTALWSATPRGTLQTSSHPTGLAEQSIALWALKPAEGPRVNDSPREESHPVAESLSSPATASFMWSPPKTIAKFPVGLCQSDGEDWTKYLVPGNTLRATNARATTLATIESTSLWTPNPAKQPEVAVSEPETQPEHVNEAESTVAYSLWSPPKPIVAVSYGLPQPAPAAWEKYLIPKSEAPRLAPRVALLAKLESTSLWTPSIAEKPLVAALPEQETLPEPISKPSATTSLWSAPKPVEAISYGLPQPVPAVWERHLIPKSDAPRLVPRVALMPKIESTSLWTPSPVRLPKVIGLAQIQREAKPVEKAEPSTSTLPLWSPPRPVATSPRGLDQPTREAWDSYLIPGSTLRRTPTREAAPAVIDSTSLWAAAGTTNRAGSPQQDVWWITKGPRMAVEEDSSSPTTGLHVSEDVLPKSPDSNTEVTADVGVAFETLRLESPSGVAQYQTADAHEGSSTLWTPPAAMHVEEAEGLFCVNHKRNDYKRTVNKAAALGTRPTPRTEKKALPQLMSTSLWSPPARHAFAHDWISLSSIRPSTPGGLSSASGSESPFSDTSSLYSTVTGLSTVGSMFTGGPEDKASRHNRHADWDAGLREVTRPSRPARDLAAAADWDTALEDAIRAGGFDPAMPAAPTDSIAAEPSQVVAFDVSRNHPAFAVSGLDTDSADVHPAGKGYFTQW